MGGSSYPGTTSITHPTTPDKDNPATTTITLGEGNYLGTEFIYTDSGGAEGNYSYDENSTLTFQAPAGKTIRVVFSEFSISVSDFFKVSGDRTLVVETTYDVLKQNLPVFYSSVGGSLSFEFVSINSNSGWIAMVSLEGDGTTPPPNITSESAVTAILEDDDVNKSIYTIAASGATTYEIGGKDKEYFTVDPSNGAVTLNKAPEDFKVKSNYHLDVFAGDAAGNTNALKVFIQTISASGATVIRQQSGTILLGEDAKGKDIIYTDSGGEDFVHGLYEDSTLLLKAATGKKIAVVFYKFSVTPPFSPSSPSKGLTVSGAETSKNNKSYSGDELPPAMYSQSGGTLSFAFKDISQDSPRDGWVAKILTLDENGDIEPPTITSSATATATLGKDNLDDPVYTITATDNVNVTRYAIDENAKEYFTVDPSNGKVTLKKAPNFETTNYNFTVFAEDALENTNSRSVSLTVTYTDHPILIKHPSAMTEIELGIGNYLGTEFMYTDSGGELGDYAARENSTLSLKAPAGKTIKVTFFRFIISDKLTVDGTKNSADGEYDYNNSPSVLYSSPGGPNPGDGILSFRFQSNSSSTDEGWIASVSLITTIKQPDTSPSAPIELGGDAYPGTTFVYTDSGGESGDYAAGENSTLQFKAPAGKRIIVDFSEFDLGTDATLEVDEAEETVANTSYTGTTLPPVLYSSLGGTLSFTFVSSSSVSTGWIASVSLITRITIKQADTPPSAPIELGGDAYPGTAFVYTDSGGESVDYAADEDSTLQFKAPEGKRMVVDFSEFDLVGATLKVDGAEETVANRSYTGTNLPPVLYSSLGGTLSFTFASPGSVDKGWKAVISLEEKGLGIKENGLEDIQIYAFKKILYVKGIASFNEGVSLEMYSILGKQVMSTQLIKNTSTQFVLPKLPAGIYLIRLKNQQGIKNKKIIIQ